MKRSIYLLLFLAAISFSFDKGQPVTEANEVHWETDFDQALKTAKKSKKYLLVFFTGSDWCGPCKELEKEFFDTEKFQNAAETSLVLYKADFPRRRDLVAPDTKVKNAKLRVKYNIKSFPTILVLNGNGSIIDRKAGFYHNFGAEEHFKMLDRIAKK